MSRVLAITGATGKKSGGYFAQVLGEHTDEINAMFDGGIRVVARATSSTVAIDENPLCFEKYIGSLDDVDFLKRVFCNVDTVVHIAGIHWSKNVVQAAASCKVRRLITIHTTGIYSKYKQAGEEYRQIDEFVYKTCHETNITLTVLRPTMIYGNANDGNVIKFIKMVDKLPFVPIVNGARYELQPVHYIDLGKAYYQVLINEAEVAGRDFNLSGGEPIELREMLLEIGNILNKKVRFSNVPFLIAFSGAWIIFVLTFGKMDYRERVQRLCESRAYSHQDATDAFGYYPMSFNNGVVDEIQEYLKGTQV